MKYPILNIKNSLVLLFLLSLSLTTSAQVIEKFENLTDNIDDYNSAAYIERSWIGQNNKEWQAFGARSDQKLENRAICIDGAKEGKIVAPTYGGGISNLSFEYKGIYSGDAVIDILVNNQSVGSLTVIQKTSRTTFTLENINIEGDVQLTLACTGRRVVIDNLMWQPYDNTPIGAVKTPTFSPNGGLYFEDINALIEYGSEVNISCATENASLTIKDNDVATTSPIIIKGEHIIKATAHKEGLTDSNEKIAYYKAFVAAPQFSLSSGYLEAGTKVTISTTTPETTIMYAVDGGEFMTYTTNEEITITQNTTLQSKAYVKDIISEVTEVNYTIIEDHDGVTESFENITSENPNSYLNISWTADDGTLWTSTKTRIDQIIDQKAICFKTGTLTSATYSGGIGTLTFDYCHPFTKSGIIEVYINDELINTVQVDNDKENVKHFSQEVNVGGSVQLKLVGKTNQVAIDNIAWTNYISDGIATYSQDNLQIFSGKGCIIINSKSPQLISIHSIDGKLLQQLKAEGRTIVPSLEKGLYIVNQQKVIVN
jgi:hypothetical protein